MFQRSGKPTVVPINTGWHGSIARRLAVARLDRSFGRDPERQSGVAGSGDARARFDELAGSGNALVRFDELEGYGNALVRCVAVAGAVDVADGAAVIRIARAESVRDGIFALGVEASV